MQPVGLDENKVSLFQKVFLLLDPHIHLTGHHENELIAPMHMHGKHMILALVEHKVTCSHTVLDLI
jgi:hypothetical protein